MNPKDEKIERENLEAFERLLDEKESLSEKDLNSYRYFQDKYGTQYRWYTNKQEDGKFKAEIRKFKTKHKMRFLKSRKERSFAKRKTAKAWALSNCRKAIEHQRKVLSDREQRKQERLSKKPVLSKEDVRILNATKKIEHYNKLIVKANTKIKTTETRKKTYTKRIKYYLKIIEKKGKSKKEKVRVNYGS